MQKNLKSVPPNVSDLEQKKYLTPEVAVSRHSRDYENETVTFSFEVYNLNQCEIADLQKKEVKKLTTALQKSSKTPTKQFLHQSASGIACKPVHDSGPYSTLYTDVPEDSDLLEIDYSKTGRIFGYLVHNVFTIVAICKRHK